MLRLLPIIGLRVYRKWLKIMLLFIGGNSQVVHLINIIIVTYMQPLI